VGLTRAWSCEKQCVPHMYPLLQAFYWKQRACCTGTQVVVETGTVTVHVVL
jgi:hypothetical protein